MKFRPFQSKEEETKAGELLATIDKGERWIFEGAGGSSELDFIDRLYYSAGDRYGVYTACIYKGELHIQIAFDIDMPDEITDELLTLIERIRLQQSGLLTDIWYRPANENLDNFLSNGLPWETKGHKVYELTAFRKDFEDIECNLPDGLTIIPFEERYITKTCTLLDRSLAHTFDDPHQGIFLADQGNLLRDWAEKAKSGDCCLMLDNDCVVGVYIIKGAEIEIIAVAPEYQGRGLGGLLLRHAIKHIIITSNDTPYLYCLGNNPKATRFYLKEGMTVTGHSGNLSVHEE